MSGFSPRDVKSFEKVRINGSVNGEKYLEEDFYDVNEAWNLLNKPLYDALRFSKIEENDIHETTFGNYGGKDELKEYIQECVKEWGDNKDAEVLFYFEDEAGAKYEFEAILRNDKSITATEKPFSFIELRHNPNENRTTADEKLGSIERMALRNAFEYTDEYLSNTNVGAAQDFIYEADLLTAFDKEGGIWDQFERSQIPFSQMIRTNFSFIPKQSQIGFEGISKSAPYISKYVTDELVDGGLSEENAVQAGKHIGTANALGLSFMEEREPEELKLDFDPRFGESLVLIDPEFGKHTTSEAKLKEDYSHFNQQIVSLPTEDWRKVDEVINKTQEDILTRANKSSKDWEQVLPKQIPENWEDEIPENRVLETSL